MPSFVGWPFNVFALMTGKLVWGRRGRSISGVRCHFLCTRRREDAKIFGSRRDAGGAERGRNIGPLRLKKCRVLGWDNHAFRCTRPRIINVAKRPVSANNLCWVASIFAASRHLIRQNIRVSLALPYTALTGGIWAERRVKRPLPNLCALCASA